MSRRMTILDLLVAGWGGGWEIMETRISISMQVTSVATLYKITLGVVWLNHVNVAGVRGEL